MKKHMHQNNKLWDYQIIKQLGRGQYGQVYLVQSKKDNCKYALKKINLSSTHQKQKIQAFREIKALKMIRHPDIIQYYESFLSVDNAYIIMEYAEKGDFLKIVNDRRKLQKFYTQQQLWDIFKTLIEAVKYLHQKNIIHRDIKLQNIFLTKNNKTKVGDLGMAKILINSQEMHSTRVGTPIYFAPQVVQHQLYSFGVDIWALGCVFYYLAALQHPFKESTIQTLGYYIVDNYPKPIKGQYSVSLISFIMSLLQKNPNKRPTIYDVALKVRSKNEQQIVNKISVFNFKQLLMIKQQQQVKNNIKKQQISQNKKRVKRYYQNLLSKYDEQQKISQINEQQQKLNESFNKTYKLNYQSMLLTNNQNQRSKSNQPMIKSNGFSNLNNFRVKNARKLSVHFQDKNKKILAINKIFQQKKVIKPFYSYRGPVI